MFKIINVNTSLPQDMEYQTTFMCVLSVLVQGICCRAKQQGLCFSVIGDMGGLPYAPFQAKGQLAVARLLAKVCVQYFIVLLFYLHVYLFIYSFIYSFIYLFIYSSSVYLLFS